MRKLENRNTELLDKDEKINYSRLIIKCLDYIPETGRTTSVMRKAYSIQDVLEEKSKDEFIELEEEEFDFISEIVKDFPWAFQSREIIEFEDHVLGLKKL